MTPTTTVQYSPAHKWHVLYNGELALRGLDAQDTAEAMALDIAANGGKLPRKAKRTGRLDLRTQKAEA